MIGCDCPTCQSTDARDRRLRPSIFVQLDDGTSVLVDAGPDLRQQALTNHIRRVDAIVFTHGHADHILGIDDVRRFNFMQKRPMACYGDARTIADIRETFAYAFNPATQKGGGLPQLVTFTVQGPFCVGQQEVVPVRAGLTSRTCATTCRTPRQGRVCPRAWRWPMMDWSYKLAVP